MNLKITATFDKGVQAAVQAAMSRGVRFCEVNETGHLIFTMTDGSILDLGNVVGPAGGQYTLPAATSDTLGGIKVGEDLRITPDGVLSIEKAASVEADNTHPITAAAVYAEVGNIDVLLQTI